MANEIGQGFFTALAAGDLVTGADVRCQLHMSGFVGEPEAINLDELTLDEFDGVGYNEYDATTVVVSWDSTAHEWRLTFDNGAGDEFGTSVEGGSEAASVLLVYLYVDGTAANDIYLGSFTEGNLPKDGQGGVMGLTLPAEGLLFARQAD